MILTAEQIARFKDAATHRPREIRDGFMGYLVWVGVGELEMLLTSHEALRAMWEGCRKVDEQHLQEAAEQIRSLRGAEQRLTESLRDVKAHNDQRIVELIQKHEALSERMALAQDALSSIAGNSCCSPCQEAALVARKALRELFGIPAQFGQREPE